MSSRVRKGLLWLKYVMGLWAAIVIVKILFAISQGKGARPVVEALAMFVVAFLITGIPAFVLGWATGKKTPSNQEAKPSQVSAKPVPLTEGQTSQVQPVVGACEGMFCTACGSKNPDDAHFCFRCGKALASKPAGDYSHSLAGERMDSIESAALWVDTQPAAANDVATTTRDATQWVLFTAVVALAGVIAAVALPTYRDYTSRQNQSAGGQAAIAPAAPSTSPTNAKPWEEYQRQAQVEADLKPFQGKTDQEITQAWSGNQFERFESVAAIEARARRYTVLDRQDAWTAVTEWQAYYMHDGKTGANEALYLAVGTVLSGFSAHKGICRPAITVVNSATAGDAFPVGAVLARLDCERE